MNSSTLLTVAAPASSVNSFRVEFRVHDLNSQLAGFDMAGLFQLSAGFRVMFMGPSYNAPFLFQDNLDTFAPGAGTGIYVNTAGRTDILVRIQRDAVNKVLEVEVWNADGSGYTSAAMPIQTVNPLTVPSTAYIGGPLTSCTLDYLRFFGSAVALGTQPFFASGGALLDLELDGTLLDRSSNHFVVAASGSIAYGATPVYPPFASQGSQRTLTGSSAQLNATPSVPLNNSNIALKYQWSQVSGPTTLTWSSQVTPRPTVSGLVFGSYVISLKVTDSSGQSASNTLKYGAVEVDSTGHVIPPSPYITQVFGPMYAWGNNPWPYFETQQKVLADFFGGLQATDYQDVWDTPLQGAVAVTSGSPTVTGSGTHFLSTFCAGGNIGFNNVAVTLWYPVPGSPGQFGRRPYAVASCQSDTVLTLNRPYITSASASSLNYSLLSNTAVGTWINGSNNANYYDNVMAFYNLYYRSGIDDYLTYARTLADRWWTMPFIDQGRDCSDGDGTTCLAPRLQSVTGLMLRALDGRPDMWPGLRALVGTDYNYSNVNQVGDLRENAYASAFVALAALLDPLPASQEIWESDVTNIVSNLWVPNVAPQGEWTNPTYGYASWNGYSGSASVTQGSTTVMGSQTQWQSGWFAGNAFWTNNANGTGGDLVGYVATVVSPTQLTLNKPYQGKTGTLRGWEANSLVGSGTQPFMMGTAGAALRFAYLATSDPRIPTLITGIANWLVNEGYRPAARGLWYGRVFPNCEPISESNPWCTGGSAEQSRFLSGEVMAVLAEAYALNGSTTVQTFGDNLYSAMYGGSGGPGADGTYVTDIATNGWAMQTKLAKDFGFFYGFGDGSVWPATADVSAH